MSLPELATRRRVTIGMLTLTMVLFGLIGLSGLKVNLLPDLSYPTLTVRTEYEGAAPLEIENLISQPVEEAVGVVKNVRKVHSVSRTGQSDVVLEFAWGTDMDMASLEVRDKLDTLQLPLEAKKPLLLRFNPSTDPIIRLGLTAQGDTTEAQLKQLRRFADDDLKKRIEPVAGVAAVKVGGGLEDEIDVSIDQQKLARLGIDINDVITRLKNENVNASGGRIEEASQRFLVRTINQFKTLDEMRELLIKVDGNVPIRLKDVAEVRQGYKEREGIVRIDGREAIELAIYKEGDANTVSVATASQGAAGQAEGHPAQRRHADHDRGPVDLHRARAQRGQVRRAARRRARDPDHLLLPRRLVEHLHHLAVAAGVADRHVLLHGAAAPVAERDVARRSGARHRHGRRRLDRRAGEHRAPAREGRTDPRSRGARHRGSRHGGDGVDPDHGGGVLPAGVRAGHRRPAVPRPGADDHLRHAGVAGRVDDLDPDAGLAEGPFAAGVSRRAGLAAACAAVQPRAARPDDRRARSANSSATRCRVRSACWWRSWRACAAWCSGGSCVSSAAS